MGTERGPGDPASRVRAAPRDPASRVREAQPEEEPGGRAPAETLESTGPGEEPRAGRTCVFPAFPKTCGEVRALPPHLPGL